MQRWGWGIENEGEGNTFAFNLKQHKRKPSQKKKKLYKFPQMKNMLSDGKTSRGIFITQTTQNELMAKYPFSSLKSKIKMMG